MTCALSRLRRSEFMSQLAQGQLKVQMQWPSWSYVWQLAMAMLQHGALHRSGDVACRQSSTCSTLSMPISEYVSRGGLKRRGGGGGGSGSCVTTVNDGLRGAAPGNMSRDRSWTIVSLILFWSARMCCQNPAPSLHSGRGCAITMDRQDRTAIQQAYERAAPQARRSRQTASQRKLVTACFKGRTGTGAACERLLHRGKRAKCT